MSWRHSSNPISTGRLWKFLERNLQNEDQCVALFFLSLHLGGFFPKVGFTSVQCHACYPFSITVSRPTSRAQHSRLVRMRLLILTSDSSFLLVDTFLKGSCFRPLASLYSSVFYFWDKNSRHPLDDDWAISISLFWLIPLFFVSAMKVRDWNNLFEDPVISTILSVRGLWFRSRRHRCCLSCCRVRLEFSTISVFRAVVDESRRHKWQGFSFEFWIQLMVSACSAVGRFRFVVGGVTLFDVVTQRSGKWWWWYYWKLPVLAR